MDAEEIDYGIVPRRKGAGMFVPNDQLIELMNDYPNHFFTLAALNLAEGMDVIFNEIDKFVVNGPCCDVSLEPGAPMGNHPGRFVDDLILWPIYKKCEKNNVTVTFTHSGPAYPDLTGTMPHRIQNIIKEFPKLNIALMHGAWPWAAAITGLAFAYTNIFIIPDIYMIHGPDWRDYVDAANYIAQDNICYGSAYPLASLKDAISYYKSAGIREEVLPKVMGLNAVRAFNLKIDGVEANKVEDTPFM